mmetsp:Transcript_12243/g.23049  ORF Transcript_12243/g.23049 Transcript_12243/m.23049 type:complete len:213 (+) Transcript_12243:99-737(+)
MASPEKIAILDGDDLEGEEPTEEQVREYAEFLDLDLDEYPDLEWIAREGVSAKVPHPWKACTENGDDVFYFNFETGESVWDHPCDDHYLKLARGHKERLDQERRDADLKKDSVKEPQKQDADLEKTTMEEQAEGQAVACGHPDGTSFSHPPGAGDEKEQRQRTERLRRLAGELQQLEQVVGKLRDIRGMQTQYLQITQGIPVKLSRIEPWPS